MKSKGESLPFFDLDVKRLNQDLTFLKIFDIIFIEKEIQRKENPKMKNTLANKFRAEMIEKMNEFLKLEVGDDIGQINSNTLNFPIVVDGEEGWCEIVIKVTKDDGDDGYLKREEYTMKLEENARKRAEKEVAKQKKIERDKKAREEKRKVKEQNGD